MNARSDVLAAPATAPRWSWLPAAGTWKYHALLLALGIFVLGPLGGVTASYMNFSLGFFVGGQVLAGILGSTVTYGYGAEGKHGANYIQTAAASVAGMSAMGVLIQAMVWMGLPQPPVWQLVLYMLCIGMFGAGVGMLYTPILVDRLQLTFPSGLAVANILRALTDPVLLRRSVNKLGGGIAHRASLGGIAAAEDRAARRDRALRPRPSAPAWSSARASASRRSRRASSASRSCPSSSRSAGSSPAIRSARSRS